MDGDRIFECTWDAIRFQTQVISGHEYMIFKSILKHLMGYLMTAISNFQIIMNLPVNIYFGISWKCNYRNTPTKDCI